MGNCTFEKQRERKKVVKKAKSLQIIPLNQKEISNKVKQGESALSTFDKFDKDKDGFLSIAEVIEFVKYSHSLQKKRSKEIQEV